MVSSVRSRPNHYETLGLTPSASEEEIVEAFARKMGELRWHPVGSKAMICIAYETLRNAAKRRQYDFSLGLISRTAPRQWSFAITPQRWAFIAAEPSDILKPHEPHVTPVPERHSSEEQRVSSFIAASLRDLARPMAREAPPAPVTAVEQRIEQILTAPMAEDEGDEGSVERRFGWMRPATAVGGFIVAAGLLGTLAGLSVTDNNAPAQAEPAAVGRSANALPTTAEDAQFDRQIRPSTRHIVARQRPSAWAQRQARAIQSDGISAESERATQLASKQLAADPLTPQSAAAKMALPDKTVARTLDRVGYRCGEVASTAAIKGSPGAFNVTCTSGKSYQAKRVNGRYRFSRSGGR